MTFLRTPLVVRPFVSGLVRHTEASFNDGSYVVADWSIQCYWVLPGYHGPCPDF